MNTAIQLVNTLLEGYEASEETQPAGPVDPNAYLSDYIKKLEREEEIDRKSGEVNVRTAQMFDYFWHRTKRRADGSAVAARRNGRTKTWKTAPTKFRIPVKIGFYDYFSITDQNASNWTTIEPPIHKLKVTRITKNT